MEKHWIYALKDPISGKIVYVGKAKNPQKRLTQHLKDQGVNRKKEAWIRGLKNRGMIPEIVLLEEVKGNRWKGAERRWIKELRAQGEPLLNISPGGSWIPKRKRRRGISFY